MQRGWSHRWWWHGLCSTILWRHMVGFCSISSMHDLFISSHLSCICENLYLRLLLGFTFHAYIFCSATIYSWILSVLFCYVTFIFFIVDRLGVGNWECCEEGEGTYENQPSRCWPYLVENKIFLKPREAH